MNLINLAIDSVNQDRCHILSIVNKRDICGQQVTATVAKFVYCLQMIYDTYCSNSSYYSLTRPAF